MYLSCTGKYAKHCIRTENKTIMDCSQVAYNLGWQKEVKCDYPNKFNCNCNQYAEEVENFGKCI